MSAALFDPDDSRYCLGVQDMDRVHSEFIRLVNDLADADQTRFAELFERLIDHSMAHFEQEEQWMIERRFPAIAEHRADHRRVMADLWALGQRVRRGQAAMGRAYVREQLPVWFSVHAATMDSALAAHLKTRSDA